MDTHFRAKAARAAAAHRRSFVLALALACAGCKSVPADRSASPSRVDSAAKAEAGPHKTAGKETLSAELAALESSDWVEVRQPPFSMRDDKTLRWRHSVLEPLVLLPSADRPDLSSALASSRPIVAANAAIVMAHWGAGQPTQKLVETIRTVEFPLGLRCAAVEALGLVQQPSPAGALRDLLQQFGADKDEPLAKLPDLHADLLRALARHAEPGDENWLTAALHSRAWQVRYEALSAWAVLGPNQDLPPTAIDLRGDRDPRIRAAALRAIAAHRDPHAIEYLQEGLADRTFDVHLAAIAALGELCSDDARTLLGKLKSHRFDLSRAATVGALAAAGMHAEVEAAANDASSQVRLAVAQTLAQAAQEGRQVAAQTVVTAQNLARDASAEVQQQAIASLSSWPLEQAGPVLLLAIAQGGYVARTTAAAQLAARWPAAADFPVDAAVESRASAIADLKDLWSRQYGAINDAAVAAKAEARQLITLSEDRVQELQQLVMTLGQANLPQAARRQTIDALSLAGPQLVVALERRIDTTEPLPSALYEEVLPGVSRTFSLLQRLTAKDVTERRAAAAEMAVETATVALSPLALNRLAELVEAEQDPLVWRSALTAVASDTRDTAVRMAYAAIGHASVEVRRGACEYLAAHGDPRHGEILLGVLQDPDREVVLSAVRALGAVRTLDDPQPLLRMLVSPDKQLQLEAALSLSRLRVRQGLGVLERLAADADSEVRLRIAKAMGEVADQSFLPVLMTMLTDQAAVRQATMISLAQIAGIDVVAHEDGAALSNDEKVRRWQFWYREHQDQESEQR
ncbi:MAG: HEAT repeat domain-containing protein [Planctomycetia bacterium]|nr:HEAT repeat domain-containing protein [Planctomycetia bacterium]